LNSARHLLTIPSEENRRSASGRAYYALLHEGRVFLDRWGFPIPLRETIHSFVRLRFTFAANADLKRIGQAVEQFNWLRNLGDYHLASPGRFASDRDTVWAVTIAQDSIDLLDAIDADPARRAAAIAAIRAAWP
jgi:hypothetical protein